MGYRTIDIKRAERDPAYRDWVEDISAEPRTTETRAENKRAAELRRNAKLKARRRTRSR